MIPNAQIYVSLLIAIAAVAVIAARLTTPPAILLVLAGMLLAVIPGLPAVKLDPEVLLLLVLPPIIYSSAIAMSWREFRFNLRPIAQLAIGCVLFTTVAVAAAVHGLLRLPWSVGFVLGAIVSPPDAVAPLAIARRLHLPRRLLVVLEGEGLANDATALVLYRFAVAAVSVGTFSFGHAATLFGAILAGEIAWGIGVGWLMLRLRSRARDTRVEILLSILTPFFAYWPPEHLGGSGVLATVCTGLYISWNGPRLIGAATRLQGIFFWDFFIYVIEGLVFLLTGLQARALASGIGTAEMWPVIIAALVVTAVVIVTRFMWMFPAIYVPRWLSPALARRDPSPPWQWAFALGFTGIRGIVSLAAALAIPLATESDMPFPQRDLIIFVAFFVILVTLVGQGLLLPGVIRALGLVDAGRREQQAERVEEFEARREAIEAGIRALEQLVTEQHLTADLARRLRVQYHDRLAQVTQRGAADESHHKLTIARDELELALLSAERETVNTLARSGRLKDEARRRLERELDLREAYADSQRAEE
jgi:Na+/H+ antiporter